MEGFVIDLVADICTIQLTASPTETNEHFFSAEGFTFIMQSHLDIACYI